MSLLLFQQVIILPLLGLSTILYTSPARGRPILSRVFLLSAISVATATGAISFDIWFETSLNLYLSISVMLMGSTTFAALYHQRIIGVLGPSISLVLAIVSLIIPYGV